MRFIIIDGPEGAGKTTHANLIRERYLKKGEKVVIRKHPLDDTKYGKKAQKALLKKGKLSRIIGSIYYSIDFVQSAQRYYGGVDTVIFIRYLMGLTFLPLILAKIVYWIITAFLPVTDYMFFLDLTPEESLKRISGEEDQEAMFKDLEGLMKSRGKALQLAGDWHVIKVNQDVSEVQMDIEAVLDDLDSQHN